MYPISGCTCQVMFSSKNLEPIELGSAPGSVTMRLPMASLSVSLAVPRKTIWWKKSVSNPCDLQHLWHFDLWSLWSYYLYLIMWCIYTRAFFGAANWYRPVSVKRQYRQLWLHAEVMRTVKKIATTLARGFDSEQAPSARSSQLVSRLLDVAWCFGGRKVSQLGGGFKYLVFSPRFLGKWWNLT